MNHIPKKLNDELNDDPFYLTCCLEGIGECYGMIQRHHNLIYAGRQVQRKFCILPACEFGHHKKANKPEIKERFDQVMLNRATDEEIAEFSRAINYREYRERLNIKYRVTSNLVTSETLLFET